ncbi:MAG: hypothetical protein J6T15_07525 [Bacilli bacterium]|nr:hypothetical protein [Bacilli bacterium]
MRRIWAHIIIAITSLIMMVVTFASITNKLTVGLDYAKGKTLTFQVTEKTDNGENNPKEFNDNSVNEVAEIMEARLEASKLDGYDVAPFGKDLVKVTVYQDSVDYTQIKEYLAFNGDLYLYSFDSDKVGHYIGSEAFINSDKPAYLTETNSVYPTINIPVDIENEQYKEVVVGAINSEQIQTKAESEEGAGDAEYAKFMYLVYGFVPGRDSFEDENFQSTVLLKFQVKSEDTEDKAKIFDYYEKDDVYALSTVLNIADSEGNVNEENVPTAWKNGNFYVNLLNAGAYDYDVTCISEVYAAPAVEELQKGGAVNQSVFTSSTFISFACAAVFITAVLFIFYKLGALSISVTSLATVFFGIFFLMIFGTEFNVLAVVGLMIVAFASIVSGCVYLNKFKDEAYRGRSVKKANTEASKKSNLVIVDIHFALLVLGAFSYLIGGVGMKSFALVTVLAGIVSLILNLTVLKGFMWLDTNASVAQGKYSLFGVDETKVPDLVNEEKQSYFGPFAEKNFNKNAKVPTIIAGVAFVAGLAAMLAFGIATKSVYYTPAKAYDDEIVIKIDNENNVDLSIVSDNIRTILDDVKFKDGSTEKSLSEIVVTESYEYQVLEYDSGEENPYVNHQYVTYVIKATEDKKMPETVTYEAKEYKIGDLFSFNTSTNVVAEKVSSACINVEYATGESTTPSTPVVYKVIIAAAAALVTTTLYMLIRYRLSRGLAYFVVTLIGATMVAGLFALIHLVPMSNAAIIGICVGEFMCSVFAILFMNKERELVLDDRKHDNSYENRNDLMRKAVSYGFADVLGIMCIGLSIFLAFAGFGPIAMKFLSVELFYSVAVAFALAMFVLGPMSQFFFKKFANVGRVKPRKSKSKGPVQNKSAEPEEAIFIGIND